MSTPALTTTVPDVFDRRQRRLLVLAWGATLLPLLAFGYLTWQSLELKKQVHTAQETLHDWRAQIKGLETKKKELDSEISRLEADLQSQRNSTKHYRDAAGIRIQFYRESDRQIVERALEKLGFNVDSHLGTSPLIGGKPNTLAYGTLVSQQDLRDIAIALVETGFPLKRIAAAIRQPDPKLIQVYASAGSDLSCALLSVEQIRAGKTCGPITKQS